MQKHLSNVGHPPKLQGVVLAEVSYEDLSHQSTRRKPSLCSTPKLEASAWKDLSDQCSKPENEALSLSWESLEQGNLAGKMLLVTK